MSLIDLIKETGISMHKRAITGVIVVHIVTLIQKAEINFMPSI